MPTSALPGLSAFFQRRTPGRLSQSALRGELAAIERVMAVVRFTTDGLVTDANDNFLAAMGYTREEVIGQHHRMFMPADDSRHPDYQAFWAALRGGEPSAGRFLRMGKAGREVWIEASYNPVFDESGRVEHIVKYATDISQRMLHDVDMDGQVQAIHRVMGVIEFALDGTIITANALFLDAVGYRLEEIRGQHHRMFVDPTEVASAKYGEFWDALRQGVPSSGEFRRKARNGRDLWLQASYNPILDPAGRPVKVVKYATDITEQKQRAADFAATMSSIDRVMGVIEFNVDGTIRAANRNFLSVMGYTLDEICGRHHSMFVKPDFRDSAAYQMFWKKLASGEFHADQYRRIAKGGNEVCIQASYNPVFDETGKVYKIVKFATDTTQQIRSMTGTMSGLIDRAQDIARTVGSVAREIAVGNADLSGRSESQAASLEEAASSMEELTSTVRQNADHAGSASSLADRARQQAENGHTAVSSAIESMGEITSATRRIADIIGVIDGIAFQTNILALNAAVEAARAGPEGRGFAVVASEVRALAQRCAASASDIRKQILAAQERVNSGTAQVETAGGTMRDLLADVSSVSEMLANIAAASGEQASGLDQINQTVSSLDESTQQNVSLVEQMSQSSRSLSEQSGHLLEVVAALSADLRKRSMQDADDGGEDAPRRSAAA